MPQFEETIQEALAAWVQAKESDSNDAEHDAASDVICLLTEHYGIKIPDPIPEDLPIAPGDVVQPIEFATKTELGENKSYDENIIGVVLRDLGGGSGTTFEVVWISDRRGIFWCGEAVGDLYRPVLDQVDDLTDERMSGVDFALAAVRMIQGQTVARAVQEHDAGHPRR